MIDIAAAAISSLSARYIANSTLQPASAAIVLGGDLYRENEHSPLTGVTDCLCRAIREPSANPL